MFKKFISEEGLKTIFRVFILTWAIVLYFNENEILACRKVNAKAYYIRYFVS